MQAVWRLLACLAMMLLAPVAQAHLTPNSEVQLDFGSREVMADIIIPQGEYGFATGNPTTNDPVSLQQAAAFLRSHISIRTPQGAPWTFTIQQVAFVQIAGPPDLHAIARLTPPAGASARTLTIEWRAVIDTVPSHFVLFVARSDFSSGKLEEDRQVLGALQGDRRILRIDRGVASMSSGFAAAVKLGMRHIAEGHDHLLFLVALLLPAPLLAAGRRWGPHRSVQATLWHLAGIVSAFTIGHSVTLIGAAALGWQLPAQPVEILIALSILISAIHAWRPLFPGREAVVAAGFGLIHGLAFATVVGHFGLGVTEKAFSILGFNIGIEVVQLAVVLMISPSLLLLARSRHYRAFRTTGAMLAMVAALAWMAERIFPRPNPIAALVDATLAHSAIIIAGLTAVAIANHALSSRRNSPILH